MLVLGFIYNLKEVLFTIWKISKPEPKGFYFNPAEKCRGLFEVLPNTYDVSSIIGNGFSPLPIFLKKHQHTCLIGP